MIKDGDGGDGTGNRAGCVSFFGNDKIYKEEAGMKRAFLCIGPAVFFATALVFHAFPGWASLPNIVYSGHGTPTEITGDGDSWLEPGEKFSIEVTLSNIGSIAATNVSASLGAPLAELCSPTGRSFGDIAVGGTGSASFEFVIPATFSPCGAGLVFDVTGKTCLESSPAGADETGAFSLIVGQDAGGVSTTIFGPDTLTTPDVYTFDNWIADGYTYRWYTGVCHDIDFARSNPYPGTYHLTLRSPVSTAGFAQVTVVMDWCVDHSTAEQYLDWSTDGMTWNLGAAFTNTVGWQCSQYVPLPSGAAGQSSLYIRFRTEVFQNVRGLVDYISILGYTPSWDCSYTGSGSCLPPLPAEAATGENWTWAATQSSQVSQWTPVECDGYRIYRGTRSLLPELCQDVSPDFCLTETTAATSYDISAADPSLDADRCYYYLINAYNSAGEGPSGATTNCGQRRINNSCP